MVGILICLYLKIRNQIAGTNLLLAYSRQLDYRQTLEKTGEFAIIEKQDYDRNVNENKVRAPIAQLDRAFDYESKG